MTRTVTYDETQWKLVPVEPTEEMIQAYCLNQQEGDYKSYVEWWNNHSSGTSERIRNYGVKDYTSMIQAVPPHPEESNFVESLDSWIPVSERLPENDLLVLIFTDNNDIITGSYSSVDYEGCWRIGNSSIIWDHNFNLNIIVNKWMPMPAAPKGEE